MPVTLPIQCAYALLGAHEAFGRRPRRFGPSRAPLASRTHITGAAHHIGLFLRYSSCSMMACRSQA